MDTNVTDTAARELAITRHISAPPERVFAAWTQPEEVKEWWGPRGMTTPLAEIDLRPGGIHRTVMRDAAGREYPNRGVIDDVTAPHRLAMRVPEDEGGPFPGATVAISFEAEGEGTRLAVRWHHPTPAMRAAHEAMGFAKGWGEMLDKLAAHVVPLQQGCPMATKPAAEHGWLHRLVGEWDYESEAVMGPDQPPMRATGVERVRSLGGFWVVGEAEGEMPGGGMARWIVTMGYDAGAGRFRGTWVGSMMGYMFLYDGALSDDGSTLTLDHEGPSFTGEGMARYRDVTELRGDDHRVLRSLVQGADGAWTEFMTAHFRRRR